MNIAVDIDDALKEQEVPSKTYCVDFENNRIIGRCDGKDALKQFIHKAIKTARGRYPILYSDDYGSDLENAVYGDDASNDYLITVVPQLIKDCLLEDDRITDVYDVSVDVTGNNLLVEFSVSSDFGELTVKEVI